MGMARPRIYAARRAREPWPTLLQQWTLGATFCKTSVALSLLPALAAAAGADPGARPFIVLLLCVALIVVLITVVRVHAFLALILAAICAGLLSPVGSLPGEPARSHWVQAVEVTATEFGTTAGKIGIVIGLAAIIGMCLMESGAADKVVRRFLAAFGEKRSGIAMLVASYVLSIPMFFDTFFMLVLPIARALSLRTGRNYVLYVLAICSAGVLTHGLVAPSPGPLTMAEVLEVDVGQTIIAGLLVGTVPLVVSWFLIKRIDRRVQVPISGTAADTAAIDRPESELPSFVASITPVILPILLISAGSTVMALKGFSAEHPQLFAAIEFLGNRNVALFIGAFLAIGLLMKRKGLSVARIGEMIGPSFETAGIIILITSAGGAFGLMLKNAGVGDAIRAAAEGRQMNLLVLAYVVSAVIRVAQGSATVALLTTAAMVQPMLADAGSLPFHPVYVFLAIAFGGMTLSWMNDSGFWVVGRLSGFTEKQTLKTWTVVLTFNSIVGLLTTLVLSKLLPLV
jgi:gluconate:H+ symporter, GntP family